MPFNDSLYTSSISGRFQRFLFHAVTLHGVSRSVFPSRSVSFSISMMVEWKLYIAARINAFPECSLDFSILDYGGGYAELGETLNEKYVILNSQWAGRNNVEVERPNL